MKKKTKSGGKKTMEMKDIKGFLNEIKTDDESMDTVASMMYGAMKSLERTSYEDYKKLKKMIMNREMGGEEFCIADDEAKMIVSQMRSKSEKGEHWTLNQVEQIGKQKGIKFDDFTVADLYLVMNMYYHDSKSVLGNSVDNYLNMALTFLQDEDMPTSASEKVYNYFCYVAELIDDENGDYGNDNRMRGYGRKGRRTGREYSRDEYEDYSRDYGRMDYGRDDYDRSYGNSRSDGRNSQYGNSQSRGRMTRGTGRYY